MKATKQQRLLASRLYVELQHRIDEPAIDTYLDLLEQIRDDRVRFTDMSIERFLDQVLLVTREV